MTIGKYCQISGERKKTSDVITSAHGIVVTAPAMMEKVYGDPPATFDEVRDMARYCAVCGAEQKTSLPELCEICQAPFTAESGEARLWEKFEKPKFNKRALSFFIDVVIIGLLSFAAIYGISEVQPAEISGAAGGGEGVNFWTFTKIMAFVAIFIGYNAAFTTVAGKTIGKMAAGLRIVLKNGDTKIGLPRAILRSVLYLFTLYVIPIGLLPLVFQEPSSKWIEIIEQDAIVPQQPY